MSTVNHSGLKSVRHHLQSHEIINTEKIDNENHQFQAEQDEIRIALMNAICSQPLRLLCNETVTIVKEYNVKRYYKIDA